MTRVNEFHDTPEICAARAADPAWQAEQARKRDEWSEKFARRRAEIGIPLTPKARGERF